MATGGDVGMSMGESERRAGGEDEVAKRRFDQGGLGSSDGDSPSDAAYRASFAGCQAVIPI